MANFNFSFDPGTSLQQMIGFEIAGRIWSSYLTDPITVNLQVGVSSSLGSKVIGGALPGISASQSYKSFTTALQADAKSADDRAALREVAGSSFSANYDFTQGGFLELTGTGTSSTLNLTRAEAKALGLAVNGSSTSLDGYIVFSNLANTGVQWNYDYTRSAPAAANSLDFLSTAMHEIGHILGFVSAVDSPNWVNSILGFGTSLLSVLPSLNAATSQATPLDLFRYDTSFLNKSDNRNLAIGDTKVFALDNYTTPIAQFATGKDASQGGDGQQASHWKAGTNALMAPTLKTGTRSAISNIDLKAFDVLGWDLSPNGINTAINLSTLQTQSKQSLASRLGQTVSWLDANSTTAAQQLGKDRSLDIFLMVVRSGIYDLSKISAATSGSTSKLTYNQLFEERGLFETLDELEVISEVSIQPSLETLTWGAESNLTPLSRTRLSPPTPGAPPSVIITLPGLDITRLSPPTPGAPPSVIITLPGLSRTRLSPPTPGAPPSVIVDPLPNTLSQSVQPLTTGSVLAPTSSVLTGENYYFYGSSKPTAYKGSDQSVQQQFASLSVSVNLNAAL